MLQQVGYLASRHSSIVNPNIIDPAGEAAADVGIGPAFEGSAANLKELHIVECARVIFGQRTLLPCINTIHIELANQRGRSIHLFCLSQIHGHDNMMPVSPVCGRSRLGAQVALAVHVDHAKDQPCIAKLRDQLESAGAAIGPILGSIQSQNRCPV